MNSRTQPHLSKRIFIPFSLFVFFVALNLQVSAQEKPPRPITVAVSTAKQLNFGTIIPLDMNSGGSVTVDYNGSVTPGGNVALLHTFECSEALFIVDAEPGVLIDILYPNPDPQLYNGGFSLQLHLGMPYIDSQPVTQFITKTKSTYVYIGGKLDVLTLKDNPAGPYSGSFSVTFIQE